VHAQDAKTLASLRRKDMPLRAGRPGGPHKDKSKYNRKTKHRKGWE
jgi:hypothetical protein